MTAKASQLYDKLRQWNRLTVTFPNSSRICRLNRMSVRKVTSRVAPHPKNRGLRTVGLFIGGTIERKIEDGALVNLGFRPGAAPVAGNNPAHIGKTDARSFELGGTM
jgi:hypothetical protein